MTTKSSPCSHPVDYAVRVGYFLAYRCESCGRIEVTDTDLRNSNPNQ